MGEARPTLISTHKTQKYDPIINQSYLASPHPQDYHIHQTGWTRHTTRGAVSAQTKGHSSHDQR